MYNRETARYRVKKSIEKLLSRIHDVEIEKQSLIDESHLIESGQKTAALGSIHDRTYAKTSQGQGKVLLHRQASGITSGTIILRNNL